MVATGRSILVLALFAVLTAAPPARAGSPPQIHPAVARVMSAESDGASFGSATLVAVGDNYGLLVTNWHVVRDSNGFVVVSFPDGFRSTATVLRVDRDWDLAALAIRKPNVQPVSLAREAPRPGDALIIAGYGRGSYRSVAGRCTQYVSPGGSHPYEIVELAASAREGDSGGPIFNTRGELAGVLFGTGWGKTAGSYCGRVRDFLFPAWEAMQRLPAPTLVAQSPPIVPNTATTSPSTGQIPGRMPESSPWQVRQGQSPQTALAETGANPGVAAAPTGAASPWPGMPMANDTSRPSISPVSSGVPASLASTSPKSAADSLSPSPGGGETFRGVLVIAGAVLLVLGGLRIFAKAA